MNRMYVLPKEVFLGTIKTGESMTPSGDKLEHTMPTIALFHPKKGAHYIDLPDGMILMITSFDHSEDAEDLFHEHPDVAIMPHPNVQGLKTLDDHRKDSQYKYGDRHHNALTSKPIAGVQIKGTDTVLDIHAKLGKDWPQFKMRNVI